MTNTHKQLSSGPDWQERKEFLNELKQAGSFFIAGKRVTFINSDNAYFPNFIFAKDDRNNTHSYPIDELRAQGLALTPLAAPTSPEVHQQMATNVRDAVARVVSQAASTEGLPSEKDKPIVEALNHHQYLTPVIETIRDWGDCSNVVHLIASLHDDTTILQVLTDLKTKVEERNRFAPFIVRQLMSKPGLSVLLQKVFPHHSYNHLLNTNLPESHLASTNYRLTETFWGFRAQAESLPYSREGAADLLEKAVAFIKDVLLQEHGEMGGSQEHVQRFLLSCMQLVQDWKNGQALSMGSADARSDKWHRIPKMTITIDPDGRVRNGSHTLQLFTAQSESGGNHMFEYHNTYYKSLAQSPKQAVEALLALL